MPIKLDRIGHCLLRVRDVERSKRFYVDVLGCQLMEEHESSRSLATGSEVRGIS